MYRLLLCIFVRLPISRPSSATESPRITWTEFSHAVTSNYYAAPSRAQYAAFLTGLPKGSISSKEEAAMALANVLHESGGLRFKRELDCITSGCPGSYSSPDCDFPGQSYYGRGYIQLSWCPNYRAASMDLYGDERLVRDPDSVAKDEQLAWDTAFWFWKQYVHGAPGVANGRFGATVRAINGARECGDGAWHYLARIRFEIYGKVRQAFGLIGEGDEAGCYN